MAKFIVDFGDNNVSKSMLEMILENHLDYNVSVKKIEPIDEEKLDEIYEEYSSFHIHGRCVAESAWVIIEKNAFKAGYRKAKEV